MISLNDIRKKIMKGDISSLLHLSSEKNIHPSEVAKLFNELPIDSTLNAFQSFPVKKQVSSFLILIFYCRKKYCVV